MSGVAESPRGEPQGRSPYIDGYFSRRIASGDTPTYGYPKNHLPNPGAFEIEVTNGFMTTLKAGDI